ncbi:MAG: hypothetical protein PHI23_00955 [Candidatus Peribacteraceae bacterium]|nr:hypothetical protein [Candidatus Peribacteraceae bacterium]
MSGAEASPAHAREEELPFVATMKANGESPHAIAEDLSKKLEKAGFRVARIEEITRMHLAFIDLIVRPLQVTQEMVDRAADTIRSHPSIADARPMFFVDKEREEQ